MQSWWLWLWEGITLVELDWDQGEEGTVSFFAYSATTGRKALGRLHESSYSAPEGPRVRFGEPFGPTRGPVAYLSSCGF